MLIKTYKNMSTSKEVDKNVVIKYNFFFNINNQFRCFESGQCLKAVPSILKSKHTHYLPNIILFLFLYRFT